MAFTFCPWSLSPPSPQKHTLFFGLGSLTNHLFIKVLFLFNSTLVSIFKENMKLNDLSVKLL